MPINRIICDKITVYIISLPRTKVKKNDSYNRVLSIEVQRKYCTCLQRKGELSLISITFASHDYQAINKMFFFVSKASIHL